MLRGLHGARGGCSRDRGAALGWQAGSGTGVRGVATAEGHRWSPGTCHRRPLICCYCECAHGQCQEVSAAAAPLAAGMTPASTQLVGHHCKPRGLLSLHFSKLGREASFRVFSTTPRKKASFPPNASMGLNLVIHLSQNTGWLVVFLPSTVS